MPRASEGINMPAYIASPFRPPVKLLVPGLPSYLWGSWASNIAPTIGNVLSDSGNGSTANVKVQITSGNIPIVSSLSIPLITVIGTSNNGGAFNTTNTILSAVSAAAVPDEGIFTLSYASSATGSSTPDSGIVQIPQPEVAEALAAGASDPVAMPYNNLTANMNQALTAVISFPSLPTSVIIYLQQAVQNYDSEFQTVATVATVSTGAVQGSPEVTIDPTLGRFFRFLNGTVVGGTSPSIIAKLLL